MTPITYLSQQDKEYAQGLDRATTLDQLDRHLECYFQVAQDAARARPGDDAEFEVWRAGLLQERKGRFAGIEWSARFGHILMPDILFRVSMVSSRYLVPWGTAFLRLEEAGKIARDDNGISRWIGE